MMLPFPSRIPKSPADRRASAPGPEGYAVSRITGSSGLVQINVPGLQEQMPRPIWTAAALTPPWLLAIHPWPCDVEQKGTLCVPWSGTEEKVLVTVRPMQQEEHKAVR